ncbi:biotin carboxylase N-terminal domain-containing protein [Streptacidiphilus monticola]|uniref:Biotin carboxylase N-terminal domain-containing protein n=1 Tax=Streptacidiphilus monticola TaxID=2161674 RepID=A0ABW1GAK8_9ACTN
MTDQEVTTAVRRRIGSVLVANRGEVARRVFASARRAGLATVAVFSDADADAPFVREADTAVRLPGVTPAQTYLRGEALVAAALAAGADAVHPGYGFLSENAVFARQVQGAGLVWIGPAPEAVERMGSKVEAKKLMEAAGVPVLPELDPAAVTAADLPVLVKASAGGGGRGMRVVRELAQLEPQLAAARAEAAAAFGDPTVFCERYLETGRHIEVQVLADAHGTVWALGERECSIQRRHQKVVEEAPSPLVERTPGMRERLFAAAVEAARAIGYEGAGTVEFLADEAGGFSFLEMNTRLQVEHPVTELTCGVDLVDLQFQVAEGVRLPAEPPGRSGHAIEVRLYAEDPARDWQPQSGILHRFELDGVDAQFTVPELPQGLRLDAGVATGSAVGVHYDPMLAKVIAWAPTRAAAARRLAAALAGARIHGLTTNRDLLVRTLRHPAFLAGDTDTAFFATHGPDGLAEPLASPAAERLSALAAALALAAANRQAATVGAGLPSGWRNVPSQPQRKVLQGPRARHEVTYRLDRSARLETEFAAGAELVSASPEEVVLTVDGLLRRFVVACHGDLVCVDSALGPVEFTRVPRFPEPAAALAAGSLLAPMPGTVVRLGAAVGERVAAGQPVLWLEAMKMEHTVTAPASGVLTALPVQVGVQVEVGAVLAVVESGEQAEEEAR